MKRFATYYIAASGGSFQLDKGKIIVPLKKKLAGLRCRITGYLKNTSGAPIVPSAADKLAILDHFMGSVTMKYCGDKRMPYTAATGTKLRQVMRELLGVEVSNYSNATSGLGQSIANGATQVPVTFTVEFPFCAPWWLLNAPKGSFAMGRTQALDIWAEIKRANTIAAMTAGLALDTNQTQYEFLPRFVDAPEDDVYSEVPHYVEKPEKALMTAGPEGLHLAIWEQTSTQAATALTEYSLRIGATEIHENANPAWVRELELDTVNFPSAADTADTWVRLYRPDFYEQLEKLSQGVPVFTQPKNDLSGGINAAYLFIPPTDEDTASQATVRSAVLRQETVKAIPLHAYTGKQVPDEAARYQPMVLKGANNRAFNTMHGLMAAKNSPRAIPHTPPALATAAKNRVARAKASGDDGFAAHEERAVKKAVASAFPGGINAVGEASGHLRDHLHQVAVGLV